ncbi:Periplasmic beta-glucosidase, partial [Linum grandiflorum]
GGIFLEEDGTAAGVEGAPHEGIESEAEDEEIARGSGSEDGENDLTIPHPSQEVIRKACSSGVKCVVILISGRPLVIEAFLPAMDALVAAFLPGSEGRGVADVLFGDYGFTGKLARTWITK